ncbi:putative mitochondrial F1F0-ATP synthase g subunit [Talaromyces proteolyticus]|uniref:Mitochondrial F1F0-ATP synthase g subunit n=1 Tax=Talaromyces proteolyticus TaxID=1131652 RepID=A0AAD4KWT7_9EURO|nr:putative mitochondrial F1F0-ATP synthase g subunit [Talaromyces proteolyticus]KAH8698647.1 putative mitochondrial F1F0-ATP synthase g subunit [Talaromyces proteolyticus]
MSPTATRAVLRQSQFLIRRTAVRHNSSNAANKAKETVSQATSKASEGLSKVSSSAGPAIAGAAQNVGNALRKVGGPTAKAVGFVERLIPPTVYYTRVGFELAQLVFRGQNMYPPSVATIQSYFQPLINAVRNPATIKNISFNPQNLVTRVRSFSVKEWAFVGVTTAEVIGFFAVGEILGRRQIVGYQGEPQHEHH